MNVAFVTYQKLSDLTPSDQLAAQVLAQRGITVTPAIWDDPTVDWNAFDQIILRSMWDYFIYPDRFAQWIDQVADLPVQNPISVVRWNLDKRYLRDLMGLGIPIVPTVWIEDPRQNPRLIMEEYGWERALLKPTVSGGAYGIQRITRENVDPQRVTAMLEQGGLMIQPELNEIQQGEWSLLFFNGQYSHAVIKYPPTGGIFVQSQHGGTTESIIADSTLIEQAAVILKSAEMYLNTRPLLYARVDGLLIDGVFTLMELEVLEPHLFLDQVGAERFADAIQALI
ncbi:MAG: hypothetical protein MUF87_20570 [Anaerolineae bacterium]|jgi:glutathione synthase/RimK-type ligase-like ATP-grasp enzyme|nr:hypothetical protein [Anaerolineae bacterium]